MAAPLHASTTPLVTTDPRRARQHRHGGPPVRPALRLVPGGPDAALRRRQPAVVYRRRRWLVLAVLVTAVVGVLAAGRAVERWAVDPDTAAGAGAPAAPSVAPGPAGSPADGAGTTYVVQPGDTLWSIARDLQPEGDVRALVDRLAAEAGGPTLQPGQRLAVGGVTGG